MRLKESVVLLMAIVISQLSFAGWTKIGSNEDGTEYSLDLTSVEKRDGYVYVWRLSEFLPNTKGLISSKAYEKADCGLKRWKNLETVFLISKNVGGNETLLSNQESEWFYPPPDSVLEKMIKTICR